MTDSKKDGTDGLGGISESVRVLIPISTRLRNTDIRLAPPSHSLRHLEESVRRYQ